MIPIYEQGSGKGIGHSAASFMRRFTDICQEHISEGRAKAFAVVVYDFTHSPLRRILKDEGVFAQLDRLSADQLSLFYLHSGTKHTTERFNETVVSTLGVNEEAIQPCVIFFRLEAAENGFTDISVAQLDHADLIHGFQELYGVVETYINAETEVQESKSLKWVKSSTKFVSLEALRAALRAFFGIFM